MIVTLSSLDHLFAMGRFEPIHLILHYDAELAADRIAGSFRQVARRFPGVDGRLRRLDDRTLAFDLTEPAAQLRIVTDEAETPLRACFDPLDRALGAPLARVRITRLGARGTAIALSMSHAVTDGHGFFLFLSAWAAEARAKAMPLPSSTRDVLASLAAPDGPDEPEMRQRRLPYSGFFLADSPLTPLPSQHVFSERRGAPESLPAATEARSMNDWLCAMLWKQIAEQTARDEATLLCPVDLRRHFPQLGPFYFGNAFLLANVTLPVATVRDAPLSDLADRIRAAVDATPPKLPRALRELAQLRMVHGLEALAHVGRAPDGEAALLVSNMARIPVPALDFGAGPPSAIEVGSMPPDSFTCGILPDLTDGGLRLLSARP